MEVVITSDEGEAGRLGADVVTELLRRRPDAVIGVATGSRVWSGSGTMLPQTTM